MLSATGFDGVDGEGNAVDAQFGSAAVDVDEAVIVMLIYYGCCCSWLLLLRSGFSFSRGTRLGGNLLKS